MGLMGKLRLRESMYSVGELRCEPGVCDSKVWVLSRGVMTLSPWDLSALSTDR